MEQLARKYRTWLISAAVVIVIIIVGLLILPSFINVNTYRVEMTHQLEQRLGRSVNLGPLGLHLLPLKVSAADVTIGDDPQFARGDFIQARSVRLRIGLWSLLRGDPQIKSIELTEPAVVLIKGPRGAWNWSTLKPLTVKEPRPELAPMDIIIHDGGFTMIDRTQSPPTEQTYTGVDADIKNFSSRTASDFTVAITMPGQNEGRLEMRGTLGPIDPNQVARSPIDAEIRMQQVELSGLEALMGRPSSHQGRLTLKADLKGWLAEGLRIKGEVEAEGLKLVPDTEPSDIPVASTFDLTAKSQGTSDYSVNIASGTLKLGETEMNITGQANQIPTSPTVDLQIKGTGISLDGLLESAHAFGFGPPKGTSASGEANINIRAVGPLKTVALNGQSQIRDLKLQSRDLPQPIYVPQLNLTFDPSAITASPFRTTLGDRTSVEITSLSIRNYREQPRLHLQVATQNGRLEDVLKMAESAGYRPPLSGTGAMSLNATVETDLGETKNATTMTGQGSLSNARIKTPSLNQPLEVRTADLSFTGDSARIGNLRAQLGESQINGWLQVKNFDHPSATFDLNLDQLIISEFRQLIAASEATRGQHPTVAEPRVSLVSPVRAQTNRGSTALANLRADGQLSIGRVLFDELVASRLQSRVALSGQTINLNPLQFDFYGGQFKGPLSLSLAGNEPSFSMGGGFSSVDVNQFLSAASSLRNVVYGRANVSMDLRGRGRQFDAIAKSLTGQGRLLMTEGKITSFDLEQQVALIGKLTGLSTGGAGTTFRQLGANFRLANGRLLTEGLHLELGQIKVMGDGALQLGAPVMTDFDVLAQLNQQLTQRILPRDQFLPAVGNFFMDGPSLVVPLKMSGPLSQPRFSLNADLLRKRMTERFTRQPGQVLENILDIFKGKEKTKPQQQPKP
jgi:uncharacterized protein involved in outer membrane biogenesis